MKEARRKKIMVFVSGRVRSGVCSCCKHPRLIVIKIYKKYLCVKCMEDISKLFVMPTHEIHIKAHKRAVADFSQAELAEMSGGAVKLRPKHAHNHKDKPRYIMDGGIPRRVGAGAGLTSDPNLQWVDPGSITGSVIEKDEEGWASDE